MNTTRMFCKIVSVIGLCLLSSAGLYAAPHRSDTPPAVVDKAGSPQKALQQLVQRTTPQWARDIKFHLSPGAKSSVLSRNDKLIISAPCASEAARAYGFYLRNTALVHFSWNGDRMSGGKLPLPDREINIPETPAFNTAFNYCTLSYTCAHWDRERWSKEIDRLAMSGYKYVLVTPGLEKVWQNFLRELGCPEEKIVGFIPAPTHAAWWNMGNLEGEGGPVSQSLIDSEAELGHFIVSRLRELGMEPILQGYVGFLPHDFVPADCEGAILPQGQWCGYARPSILQPTAPAFDRLAALWYKHLHAVYGISAQAYGGDLFHEGGRKGNTNLTAAAENIQHAMQAASPGSLWFLQAWANNPDAALLQGTSTEHTVILFLNKNLSERPSKGFDFQGRKHVWCELSNFGGNNGLFGGVPLLEKLSGDAGGYCGLGLLSEGLETNPFYYALFTERLNNRGIIDREDFIRHYTKARYACDNEHLCRCLSLLSESVYCPDRIREGCLENLQCARPSLWANKVSTWSNPTLYYDTDKVEQAARELLAAGKEAGTALTGLSTYRYDLADVCRQVMADRARRQLERCRKAFEQKDEAALRKECDIFLRQIDDTAEILACSEYFLLGRYLEGVRRRGKSDEDKAQLEKNMRCLISTWKPQAGTLLDDYANREFAEMLSSYYKCRWEAYFNSCIDTLRGEAGQDAVGQFRTGATGNNGQNTAFRREKNSKVEAIELAFPTAKLPLLTQPEGDIIRLAEKLLSPT